MKHGIKNLFNTLWKIFLEGLIALLPITLTIAVFTISFKIILRWVSPLKPLVPQFLINIPYAEVILVFIIIFIVGAIVNFLILKLMIHYVERLIARIPIVYPVYSGIKQLTKFFSVKEKANYSEVVIIEFPRIGIYSIGFLTSPTPEVIISQNDEKYWNVFIPHTPNPTTGSLIFVSEKQVQHTRLTRQEAMSMIISGGIIKPIENK